MMQVTLGNTIGAGLLGCTAAAVLFGVAIVQAYIYYTHYPKDWVFQKAIVGFLLFVDTVHTGMTTHTVYYYVIEQFGNVFALEFVVWSFKLQVLFNVFILLLVQTLYVMRIWKLASHFSRVWPAIIIAILIGGYAIGFLLAFHSFRLKSWDGLDGMASVVKASFSCSTAIDIILAASMCYYLNRSKTSFVGTNNRIVAVIHYVLISGSLTSATSLAILLCFLAMPNNLIFISITFIVTKVYINSYLAMLNARNSTRDDFSSNMGRIMRSGGGTHPSDLSTSVAQQGDKLHPDSLQLSSLDLHSRLGKDASTGSQSKPNEVLIARTGVIDIQILRTEEKRVQDKDGHWSPV